MSDAHALGRRALGAMAVAGLRLDWRTDAGRAGDRRQGMATVCICSAAPVRRS